MKVLIQLEVQEYMSMQPEHEYRLIDADNLRESLNKERERINHMNATWSGGVYSNKIKVLTQMEALQFAQSDKVNPSKKYELIESIRNDYYDDHLYDPDPDEPWWQR